MPYVAPELVEASKLLGACRQCGMCCWDHRGNRPEKRCEYHDANLRLCLAYDRWHEPEFADCVRRHTLLQACDLHPDCGYMVAWREAGLLAKAGLE